LEAHKPVAFIGSQFLLVTQPVLDIFLPQNLIRNTVDLLGDSDQLEQLIIRLEMDATSSPTSDRANEKAQGY